RTTLEQRVRDLLWDKQRAITEPPKEMSKGYEKYARKASGIGVSRNAFYTRVQRGWSLERAAATPVKEPGKKFLDEQRKLSIQKTHKHAEWVYEELDNANRTRCTGWQRLNTHKWSAEKACTTPTQEKPEYDRTHHTVRDHHKLTFIW